MSVLDITGRAIDAGMTIAFAKRVADVARLELYIVHAIVSNKIKARPVDEPGARMSTISTSDKQVIIHKEAP